MVATNGIFRFWSLGIMFFSLFAAGQAFQVVQPRVSLGLSPLKTITTKIKDWKRGNRLEFRRVPENFKFSRPGNWLDTPIQIKTVRVS